MKSIIEEAPSILKAIEKAWIRAGNPVEFSVKIFEDAQKNFFGFSSKNAKVGVFFEIEPIKVDGGRPGSQSAPTQIHHTPRAQKEEFKPRGQQSSASPASSDYAKATSDRSNYEGQARQRPSSQSASRQASVVKTVNKPTSALEPAFDELVEGLRDRSEQVSSETSDVSDSTHYSAAPKARRIAWTDDMLAAVSMWLKDLLAISNLGSHQPTLTVLDSRLIILFTTPLYDDPAKASDLYRSLSYLLIGMVRSKFKKEFRFLKIVLTDGIRDREHNES